MLPARAIRPTHSEHQAAGVRVSGRRRWAVPPRSAGAAIPTTGPMRGSPPTIRSVGRILAAEAVGDWRSGCPLWLWHRLTSGSEAAGSHQAPLLGRSGGPPAGPGSLGDPGPPDDPGSLADPGSPGDSGSLGDPGSPDDPGSPGYPGSLGDSGSLGDPGSPDDPGSPGYPGFLGDPGSPGRGCLACSGARDPVPARVAWPLALSGAPAPPARSAPGDAQNLPARSVIDGAACPADPACAPGSVAGCAPGARPD